MEAIERLEGSIELRAPSSAGPIYWLTVVCVLLSFTMAQESLNLFIHYTISGGSAIEKFHPATFVAVPLLFLVLADGARTRRPLKVRFVAYIAVFSALSGYLAATGILGYATTIVDIYVAPAILLLAISRSDARTLKRVLALFVWIAVANAFVVLLEFVVQKPLIPVDRNELFFRPAGFLGHPITAGTIFYCALFLVVNDFVRVPMRRSVALLLVAGVGVCAVRGPLTAAVLILMAGLRRQVASSKNRFSLAADVGIVALLPAAAAAAYWSGALDRVIELGFWEESAQSRFYVFDVINLLTKDELWHGVGYDIAQSLTQEVTGGATTENFVVFAILTAGVPFACALTVAVVGFYWQAIRRSAMFALIVGLIFFTTIAFGVKNPVPAAVALIGYAIVRLGPERAAATRETSRPLARPASDLQASRARSVRA